MAREHMQRLVRNSKPHFLPRVARRSLPGPTRQRSPRSRAAQTRQRKPPRDQGAIRARKKTSMLLQEIATVMLTFLRSWRNFSVDLSASCERLDSDCLPNTGGGKLQDSAVCVHQAPFDQLDPPFEARSECRPHRTKQSFYPCLL